MMDKCKHFTTQRITKPLPDQKGHLATDNILIWVDMNKQQSAYDIPDVNGSRNIKTKTEVLNYLRDSFRIGRQAIKPITAKSATDFVQFRWRKLSWPDPVFYGIVHTDEQ